MLLPVHRPALAAMLLLTLLPSAARAQQGNATGWTETKTATGVQYNHEAGNSVVLSLSAPQPATNAVTIDSALRAKVAAVPRSNRPSAMIILQAYRLIGSQLVRVNEPWLIFSNGDATDCFGWNPLETANADGLAPYHRSKNCRVSKWRKSGAGYEILMKDNKWLAQISGGAIPPAAAGTRLSLDLESVSGAANVFRAGSSGVGGFIDDGGAVGTVKIGNLLMTPDGNYRSRKDVREFDKLTSGASASATSGRYYVAGYIIGLYEPDGNILVGVFGKLPDRVVANGRTYKIVYLNGVEYSSKSSR